MAEEKIVVILLAERGKKYDTDKKCIGSYEQSIVFFPADVKPGEIVRVSLHEVTEKKDSRGLAMYFARHAPVPVSDDILRQIRNEAAVLQKMQVFDEKTALALLHARHGAVVAPWKRYRHYYFDESGAVYASGLSPATLPLFAEINRGQGATELLIWVLDGTRPDEHFLYRKRERGEEISRDFAIPPLGDKQVEKLETKVANQQLLLSDPLIEVRSGVLHSEGWADQLFQQTSWPPLPMPDFAADLSATIPDITELVYGHDMESNSLVAYGVICAGESWSNKILFTPSWEKTRKEAEAARYEAILGLMKFREKLEEDRLRAEEESRRKAAEETARIAAETEATRKTEYVKRMQVEVEAGRAISDFRAYVRRSGSEQGDGWVIMPDGSLREPDEIDHDHPRGFRYSHKIWRVVGPREIALQWKESWPRVAFAGAPGYEPTPEQLARMRELEKEAGLANGAFGFKPKSPKVKTPTPLTTKAVGVVSKTSGSDVDPDHPFSGLVALRKKMSGEKK